MLASCTGFIPIDFDRSVAGLDLKLHFLNLDFESPDDCFKVQSGYSKNVSLRKSFKNTKFVQNTVMQRLLTENIEEIQALCKAHNVKSLFAFGSVCTNKLNDESDIDLLISFNPMDYGDYADTYFNLADQFENLFKRPVDLVTDKSLYNPYFIASVNQTKTLLYAA